MFDETLKAPAAVHHGSQTDDSYCRQRTELLYRNGHFANLSGLLVAGISAVVLWPIVDPGKLIVWLGLYGLLFVARGLLVHSFKRAQAPLDNARIWLHALVFSIACSGALWGALGFFFRFDWNTAHQIFLLAVLAGLAAGAIATYGATMRSYYAFVLPMLVPNAAYLLFSQERAQVIMGAIVMLYCLLVGYVARIAGGSLRRLTLLRNENADLLQELTSTNAALRAQAGERTLALQEIGGNERNFRDLVEGSTQGILIHRDWHPLFANKAFADLLGFNSPQEVLSLDSLQHLFASYELKRVHTHERRAISDDLLVKYEAEAVRNDGTRVILQCIVRSVLWGGDPAIQISLADISDLVRTTKALQAVEETYQQIFSTITDAALLFDAESGTLVNANRAALSLYGYGWDEVLNLNVLDLTANGDTLKRAIERAKLIKPAGTFSDEHQHKLGHTFPVEISMSNIEAHEGNTICAIVRDVTDRQQAEDAVRESEERFRVFAETAADFFWETNAEQRYTYVSERYSEISGLTPEQLLGIVRDPLTTGSVAETRRWQAHQQKLANYESFRDLEVSCVRPEDGGILILRNSATPMFDSDGAFKGYRGVVRNVTEAYNLSRQLSYQASHDALTGLVNRAEFERRLQESLEHLRVTPSSHALCYLDLDQFKLINDTCGHAAGDELLRQISAVLQQKVRRSDTLARLGGDEFAILMENCTIGKATEVADSVRHAIEEFQFLWDGKIFTVGVSIGVVPIRNDGERFEDLLRAADSACYAAKDNGRNRVHIYHAADEELARREGEMQWVARINQAFEEELFELRYQRIAPAGRQEHGAHYELLLRMRDEEGQPIPPGAYLPAAERYNLIGRLDRWVIDTAIGWLEQHPEHLADLHLCSINLSGLTLGNEEFLTYLIERLRNTPVPGSRLCFEITETAAIQNLANATRFIGELRKRGCRFALDDFGSGLSSFAYLKNLPVDYLKIDGVFVRDIIEDPIDYAMVKSINEIGKVMGKKTIAEFVESGEIVRKLEQIGVDYLQGQYIGEPRPLSEFS
ncbi:MAG: EAL domain-containing protein [Gammaproteobacteria bacterium]|nr:EAL domain-containing protein [Gammaproteobacteria bacterium]